jgi:hypothetical protein
MSSIRRRRPAHVTFRPPLSHQSSTLDPIRNTRSPHSPKPLDGQKRNLRTVNRLWGRGTSTGGSYRCSKPAPPPQLECLDSHHAARHNLTHGDEMMQLPLEQGLNKKLRVGEKEAKRAMP